MTNPRYAAFSLIEVVVSSALVATTVGALFAAASLSTRLTILGQERVSASQLAREGLEIAKNIRDQNFINDTCGTAQSTSSCADWRNGLLTTEELAILPSKAITKRVVVTPQGYTLDSVNLESQTCTDYISRETLLPDSTLQSQAPQIFCRRIFIEPMEDETIEGSTLDERSHTIRVRSQVAWVGNGRNELRTFSDGGLDVFNPCDHESEEWCTEQVTILTDWRASNE